MTTLRIQDALTALFKDHSIVFWHDVEAEFASVVDSLQLDGVQGHRQDYRQAQ